MVTETFLCSQKEDVGQEPSAQNEIPVIAFFCEQLGRHFQ